MTNFIQFTSKFAKKNIYPFAVYIFIRILNLTYRFHYHNTEVLDKFGGNLKGRGFLFACWHRNIVGAIIGHIGARHVVLVSPSADGGLISKTLQFLGHKVVRGSSSRGGKQALAKMVKLVKDGWPSSITVDGPRGPARICKNGIIVLASRSGKPIVPVIVKARKSYIFEKSWDRFVLPIPFSSIDIYYGDPIYVESEISDEVLKKYSLEVKSQLDQ